MKRDDIVAGIVGGTIFVVGCTVAIFGYKKMNEPIFSEAKDKTAVQTVVYESSVNNGNENSVHEEPREEIPEVDPEDDNTEYNSIQEDYITDRLITEDDNGSQSGNRITDNTVIDPGVTVLESTVNIPSDDEPVDITNNSGNFRGDASKFNTYDIPEQQDTSDEYVLNTSTLKIHYPHCNDVKKIKPENYETTNESIDSLKARGYELCGHCFK